jgi:hypothetical protein
MSLWKLAIVVILLGVVGVFAYDGVQVLDAHKNITDTANAAASAAAQAIATSKRCTRAAVPQPTPAPARAAALTPAGGNALASAPAKSCADGRTVADNTAKGQGDVVTAYTYDPVAARVWVTVSGSAKSLVLHYVDRNLTDNIRVSSSARPE